LEKDYELVLVDALDPFGNEQVFPRGLLREPLSALQRAQAIWITHADLVSTEQLEALQKRLVKYAPEIPIACTFHKPVCLRDFATGERLGLWVVLGKRVLALSGIGNPSAFEIMLERMGAEVIPARFPDHHLFAEAEVTSLLEAHTQRANLIITTAKDAVRLPRNLKTDIPLRVLEVKLGRFPEVPGLGLEEILEEAFYWLTPGR
jgi:tetraacyldisaccharide 4'-kinase